MRGLAYRFLLVAVASVLVGMVWGIQMAISGDHGMAGAHAHLNLLGFVLMAVFAGYYAVTPTAASSGLAKLHFSAGVATIIVFIPGIALAIAEVTEALVAVGSLIALASMILFLIVVLRHGVGATDQPA